MNATKSFIDKLNLAKYTSFLVLNKPENMKDFEQLTFDSEVQKEQYDCIFIFVFQLEEFEHRLKSIIEKSIVANNGYVYFAYPKKNNKQYEQYIERDSIFPYIKPDEDGYVYESNLKFSRMVSLNDVFTLVGLKCDSKKSKNTSTSRSQRVDDYVNRIDDLKQYLTQNKNTKAFNFFNGLTPGYQKLWARYVYSAKTETTQKKRTAEVESALTEGFKSIELYRASKK